MSSKEIYIKRIIQVAATPGLSRYELVKMLTLSQTVNGKILKCVKIITFAFAKENVCRTDK